MLRLCTTLLLASLLLRPTSVSAEMQECLDPYLVVQHDQIYDFHHNTEKKILLPSKNSQGSFFTAAAYHFQMDSLGKSALTHFSFTLPGQVSLPYNIYQVEFFIGEEGSPDFFHFRHDFTQNCSEAGSSLFPGQELHMPEIKIPPLSSGAPRLQDKLRIRIWGHL